MGLRESDTAEQLSVHVRSGEKSPEQRWSGAGAAREPSSRKALPSNLFMLLSLPHRALPT